MDGPPQLNFTPESKLEFQALPGTQSQVILRLENPHDQHVAFKIKTTAPKSYLVKPSSGVIAPRKTLEVSILLVPQYESPKEPSQDRFLVQSTFVSKPISLTKEEWSEAATTKKKLDERKLNVSIKFSDDRLLQNRDGEDGTSSSIANLISKPIPADLRQLRQMYEELVIYALAAEKQKRELEVEVDELRRNSRQGGGSAASSAATRGFEAWQVALLMLGVIAGLKLIRFL